jgi:hypothetical protein
MTPGRRRRRASATPGVTWLRVRARPGRALLVGLGVALALAFVVDVAGGSIVSEDLALRRALTALAPADRVVRVSWSGQVATGGFRALDRTARRALRTLTRQPIDTTIELADVQLGHGLVKLGAADSLGDVVNLESGRLPRLCRQSRCEVVQLGGTPVRRIDGFGVHLVVVGRGTLASTVPFGAGALSTQPAGGGSRTEPVLVTAGVAALARLPPLVEINRDYSWSAALEPRSVHVWSVDRLFAAEGRATARLAAASGEFSFTGPDDALAVSRSQSVIASHRILLVGSSAALLLLAFLSMTAGGLRRDARAELRRLVTRGATQAQQWTFLLAEAAVAVLPGAVAGVALGVVADALLARHLGVPVGDALRHGLSTPAAVLVTSSAAAGALVVVLIALSRPERRLARGVQAADMAAVGAVVALGLVVVGGRSGTGGFGVGSAVALAATPLLASFALTVLLARVLEPGVKLAVHAARRGPSSLLVALLTLYRAPRRTAGIVGFLAVSIGLAAFALSYRATLATSSAQSAAYDVPLDYTLTAGPALVAPQDVATLQRYRSLAGGVGAWPILRQTAEVAESGATPATPDVIGVPAPALKLIHGWRSDFSPDSPATLARLVSPTYSVRLAGARIPGHATRLDLRARATGAAVQLVLVVLTRAGGADQLRPPLATSRTRLLGIAVPAADRGGRLIAIQLELPSAEQRSAAHQAAEGRNAPSGFGGILQLGPLAATVADGRRVTVSSFASWIGRNGVAPRAHGDGERIRFDITTSEQAIFRPRQPFDTRRLPVIASPDVASSAGPGGSLELNFGDQVVQARLVAVAKRFPTTQDNGESFVIADEASLAAALGANDLPTAIPGELWLSTPPAATSGVGAALQASPFSSLAISSRAAIAIGLRDAPLARGIVISLLAAAAVALVLALVGLALATVGFVRDEGDALFDLESQGLGPRSLRASLRWRALGLAALGLPAGVALGIGMVAVVGRLLALDATLAIPDPPLERVTPWATIGASACVFALLAVALVELVLRVAYRAGSAGRGTTGESWAA